MLHRLTLRVLPSLALAVTDEAVRRQKRLVMFVPGLAAFALYRVAKHVVSVADPLTLLMLSGCISAVTAVCAYRVGRRVPFRRIPDVDGISRIAWVVGWVGFVYGVQLSLLVLALLWMVGYDYGQHPDGPAMMAIIISCTAVARDAFEIGHVRFLQAGGRPFVTFPDGMALRTMVNGATLSVARWVLAGAVSCCLVAAAMAPLAPESLRLMAQVAVVTLVAGVITLLAYFDGRQENDGGWMRAFASAGWAELVKFWWWPGLAFAATYYLVVIGALVFPLQQANPSTNMLIASGAAIGALMGLYGYYLGHRRQVEDRVRQEVPASLLRCPFVMGILGRSGIGTQASNGPAAEATLSSPRLKV
jgi:hypothetical protein